MRSPRLLRRFVFVVSALAGLVLNQSVSARSTPPTTSGSRKTAGVPASTTTQSCFSSGAGAGFLKVCVSTHGNVLSVEAPSGNVIKGATLEGYELCDVLGLRGYDAASGGESGFGDATISQPNGTNKLPLTITRDTTDGNYRLTQTFDQDKAERDFTIAMRVKNLTASSVAGVRLVRYFDANIDGDSSDDVYDDSVDSVWGRDVSNGLPGHALSLTALTLGIGHQSYLSTSTDLSTHLNTCGVASSTGPTAPGDFGGLVFYEIGTIAAGAGKTVKVVYRVF